MADKNIDMQIGLGVEYDATGIDEANADLEQLAETKEVLVVRTNEVAEADAKEQKAMQLATKTRNELIRTLTQLQKELKAAAEAQDVEKYRAIEQEIADTRQAFEKQNQALELNNIQLGQQAQNGMMVASTLANLREGLEKGTISAGDFANGIISISAAIKAGLGPIGWLMLAVQGLQAAWDAFSASNEKEAEVQEKRAEDMQRLADITTSARKALEDYNRTELSKKALADVKGYYKAINAELDTQIKRIDKATAAELARAAITQDEEEHTRTLKRAALGRQLAAGTITQEEYDKQLFDMNEAATMQKLDADVATAEAALSNAEAKLAPVRAAYEKADAKSTNLLNKTLKFGNEYTVEKLKLMEQHRGVLEKEKQDALKNLAELRKKKASKKELAAAQDRSFEAGKKLGAMNKEIIAAFDTVYGEGQHKGKTPQEMLNAMTTDRADIDQQFKVALTEKEAILQKGIALENVRNEARADLQSAQETRSRKVAHLEQDRKDAEAGRAFQKLLDEKQTAAVEVVKLEKAELKRRRKDAEARAAAARAAGDAEGSKVLSDIAAIYKAEAAQRALAAKNKAAVEAAIKTAEAAPPSQDKRTDELMKEAMPLAQQLATGQSLDGRSAEQLIGLLKEAKATKDKKDDAFIEQLINLAMQQTELTTYLQGELRKLKRKTEKLTRRNFD